MDPDLQFLQTHWWTLTLRGIFAIIFGIAAVFWPHLTILTLLYIFAAWVLVDGVVRIVTGISRLGTHQLGVLTILAGLLGVGVGVYLLRHPGVTFATLILLIGFLLIFDGILATIEALTSSDSNTNKTLSIIIGIAAVIAGIIILAQPAKSGVAFVWILGLYALITGPMLIAMSLDVHNMSVKKTK